MHVDGGTGSAGTPCTTPCTTLDFHHTCYGLVSDVDQELENPSGFSRRFLSTSLRNNLVPVKHIILMRQRRCKLTIYAGPDGCSPTEKEGPIRIGHDDESDFAFVSILSCNYIDPTLISAPGARYNDGFLHVVVCRKAGRWKGIGIFGELETGEHLTKSADYCEYYKTRKVEIAVPGGPGESVLDVCGNGEKPFANCTPENTAERRMVCEILPGYLQLMLPERLFKPVV